MAALVIALLLAFAGALLRTNHIPPPSISNLRQYPHAMATRYLVIAVAVLLCAVALLYMVDHESLIPRQRLLCFQPGSHEPISVRRRLTSIALNFWSLEVGSNYLSFQRLPHKPAGWPQTEHGKSGSHS